MKKAKQSNPLKTFNDNYDNRVKKVTEGNKKLVKAQVGKNFIADKDYNIRAVNDYFGWDTKLPKSKQELDSLKSARTNEGYVKDNKRAVDFYLTGVQGENYKRSPADTNYYDFMFNKNHSMRPVPKFIESKDKKGINMVKKNGGATKSKKK
jgi:hypothetical protein